MQRVIDSVKFFGIIGMTLLAFICLVMVNVWWI